MTFYSYVCKIFDFYFISCVRIFYVFLHIKTIKRMHKKHLWHTKGIFWHTKESFAHKGIQRFKNVVFLARMRFHFLGLHACMCVNAKSKSPIHIKKITRMHTKNTKRMHTNTKKTLFSLCAKVFFVCMRFIFLHACVFCM